MNQFSTYILEFKLRINKNNEIDYFLLKLKIIKNSTKITILKKCISADII